MDKSVKEYDNIILLGDFNLTPSNKDLQDFLNVFNFKILVNEPTCFKGEEPSCINLIITNQKNYFKKFTTFVTGISDIHKSTAAVLKSTFVKGNRKIR